MGFLCRPVLHYPGFALRLSFLKFVLSRVLKMISFKYVRALRLIRSAAFSCLITAPATGFFILVMCLALNNSLADSFIKQARALVSDVPAGMVRECIQPRSSVPVSPVLKPSALNTCKEVFTDEDDWKASVDNRIQQFYIIFVAMGLLCWLFTNNRLAELISGLQKLKRKPQI
ncbi:hypothetical protein ABKW25_20560 (plasmid) [Enterobacter hormaechei]|jgi:hypothetical protein|uniref:hypothetical protein n=1 Tax=Enterobacterales TaxID=91347 RepID=UPI00277C9F22|nr:hypothetical protein [Enterobacter kobei]HDR2529393.1 hypothetical protein [Enterobacter ludwigii]HDS6669194.1 hypothetical protein [Enterobacter ludwigii]